MIACLFGRHRKATAGLTIVEIRREQHRYIAGFRCVCGKMVIVSAEPWQSGVPGATRADRRRVEKSVGDARSAVR